MRFDLNFISFPPGFAARFVNDYNLLAKHGYGLDTYFRLYYSEENAVTLQLYYHTIGDGTREFYKANYRLEVIDLENGGKSFAYTDADENGRRLIDEFQAYGLLDFFAGYGYEIDWERSSCPDSNYVGFYPLDTPNAGYAYGLLGN